MRKLLATSLLLGLSSIAAATPATTSLFQGFYVGANASLNNLNMTDKFTTIFGQSSGSPFPTGSYSNSVNHTSYSYGENLFAGYNFQLSEHFLLGIETRVLAASKRDRADVSKEFPIPPADQPPSSMSIATTRNLTIDGGAINLLLKPELLLSTNRMVYALLGAGYATMHADNTFSASVAGVSLPLGGVQIDKVVAPFTIGLGYAQYITTNLSWTAELSDTLYPNLKGDVTIPANETIPQTFTYHDEITKISMMSANLGLSYYFKGV